MSETHYELNNYKNNVALFLLKNIICSIFICFLLSSCMLHGQFAKKLSVQDRTKERCMTNIFYNKYRYVRLDNFFREIRGVYVFSDVEHESSHNNNVIVIMPHLSLNPKYEVFLITQNVLSGSVNILKYQYFYTPDDSLTTFNNNNQIKIIYNNDKIRGIVYISPGKKTRYIKKDTKFKYVNKYYYSDAYNLNNEDYKEMMRTIFRKELLNKK